MIPAQLVVAILLGWLQREQSDAIDYLREENRILKEQLGPRSLPVLFDFSRLPRRGHTGSERSASRIPS